jgi:hypothetical protein
MAVEKLTMFPIATRHLDSDDWSSILRASPHRSADPLFQTPVPERFVQLDRVIASVVLRFSWNGDVLAPEWP